MISLRISLRSFLAPLRDSRRASLLVIALLGLALLLIATPARSQSETRCVGGNYDWDQAVAICERDIQRGPATAEMRYWYGRGLEQHARYAEAEQQFLAAAKNFPRALVALYWLRYGGAEYFHREAPIDLIRQASEAGDPEGRRLYQQYLRFPRYPGGKSPYGETNRLDWQTSLCGLLDGHLPNAAGSPLRYVYQSLFFHYAGVLPADSILTQREKVRKLWKTEKLYAVPCKLSNAAIGGEIISKFAVDQLFDGFIIDIAHRWKLDLDFIDPVDGRTLLDFTQDSVAHERRVNSPLATRLETYVTLMQRGSAKNRVDIDGKDCRTGRKSPVANPFVRPWDGSRYPGQVSLTGLTKAQCSKSRTEGTPPKG